MQNQFSRTELIWGHQAIEKLANSRVAVFGVGGVGCAAVEALARAGIGNLDLIDSDKFSISNLNRQLFATHETVGQYKVAVAAKRIAEINPACKVKTYQAFFLPENSSEFDFRQYDYVIDAIDTVSGKIGLVMAAKEAGVPIICAMGAGNKVNAAAFEVADLYKTSVCPLAHVMRKELRRRGIKNLKVVYSKEPPLTPQADTNTAEDELHRRSTPGSVSFVPPVVGFIMAGEVINDLVQSAAE